MKAFSVQVARNVDFYASILLGLVFASLGLLGIVNFRVIASSILATLTLFVFSAWRDRRRGEQLAEVLNEVRQETKVISDRQINQRANIRPSDVIIQDVGKIKDLADGCRQIFMAGVSLYTRTQMLKFRYRELLQKGCSFKFIVLAPNSPVLTAHARLSGRTAKDLQSEIEGSLILFASLKEYADTNHTPGRFEFAAFDYDPTLILMRFEYASTNDVLIQVELPVYQIGIWERPSFQLTRADRDLFNSFDHVCTQLWNDATVQDTK